MMSLKLPLFITFCLITYSSQASTDADFIKSAMAILQNKNTLFDSPSYLYTFAYWQDSFSNFSGKEDIISVYSANVDGGNTLDVSLKTYKDNGLAFHFKLDFDSKSVQINQTNATIKFSDVKVYVKYVCPTDIDIYFVEKATQLPPQTFDASNLHAYTKQFRFISDPQCGSELTTSIFDDGYPVSLFDKILFIFGSLVYIFASIDSRSTPKPNKHKVSAGTLRLLMFFSYYTLAYFGIWLIQMNMFSDLLFLFIPFLIALLIDFIKRSIELSKNDGSCCCCLVIALFPAFVLAVIPDYGAFIGNLLPCLYMLPQLVLKYKERHIRQRFLTRFEIGNFTCLSLWVLYLDLYPNNVFLTSPQPVLVFIYVIIVLIQLSVLVYLEYGVPRQKLFKYTFAGDQEKLVEEECAICLSAFEVNAEDGKLYKTPCDHFFHPECLRGWAGRKLECPCCRKKIPGFADSID